MLLAVADPDASTPLPLRSVIPPPHEPDQVLVALSYLACQMPKTLPVTGVLNRDLPVGTGGHLGTQRDGHRVGAERIAPPRLGELDVVSGGCCW